jgi:hypothetical protein
MSSYGDLVNIEIGNNTNYGSNFKLSRHYSLELAKFLKQTSAKEKCAQKRMRVYIAGWMGTGNTHYGHFVTGYTYTALIIILSMF